MKRQPIHPIVRFFNFVRENETGCWIWIGARNHAGYGDFFVAGKKHQLAHLWAFENLRGEQIDPALDRDHLCRNPGCVNPWHLEQVTHRENMLRGETNVAAVNADKVVCIKGHALTPDNLAIKKRGDRVCKICRDEYNRQYHRQRYNNDPDYRARKKAIAAEYKCKHAEGT